MLALFVAFSMNAVAFLLWRQAKGTTASAELQQCSKKAGYAVFGVAIAVLLAVVPDLFFAWREGRTAQIKEAWPQILLATLVAGMALGAFPLGVKLWLTKRTRQG